MKKKVPGTAYTIPGTNPNGAANRTRTGTGSLLADFKSAMSTYSIIAAYSVVSLLRQEPPHTSGGMFRRDAPKKHFSKRQKVADINGF